LVHSEKDDGLTRISLPMFVKDDCVYDAVGKFLFRAATEDIACSLVEALETALDICMSHNGKNIVSVKERKGTVGILN